MIELLICAAIIGIMCWFFSWKVPSFVLLIGVLIGAFIGIGWLIGIGINLATGG